MMLHETVSDWRCSLRAHRRTLEYKLFLERLTYTIKSKYSSKQHLYTKLHLILGKCWMSENCESSRKGIDTSSSASIVGNTTIISIEHSRRVNNKITFRLYEPSQPESQFNRCGTWWPFDTYTASIVNTTASAITHIKSSTVIENIHHFISFHKYCYSVVK